MGSGNKRMWIDAWECHKNVKIFVSHVNTHQRTSLMEEAWKNHIVKITWPFDISWSWSLATPVLAHGHMNGVVMVGEMKAMHGSSGFASIYQE